MLANRMCGGILLALALAAGCEDIAMDEQGSEKEQTPDERAADLLADKDHVAEVRDWLLPEHKDHHLWKAERKAITKLVADLYAAGAPKVYVVDINEMESSKIVAMFVVVMPSDATQRGKVLDVHNAFWKSYLEEEPDEVKEFLETDKGQKYITLDFDL